MEGLEPPHLTASDPKSDVSTNFTTSGKKNCLFVWITVVPIVIGIWQPDAQNVKQVSCQLGSLVCI